MKLGGSPQLANAQTVCWSSSSSSPHAPAVAALATLEPPPARHPSRLPALFRSHELLRQRQCGSDAVQQCSSDAGGRRRRAGAWAAALLPPAASGPGEASRRRRSTRHCGFSGAADSGGSGAAQQQRSSGSARRGRRAAAAARAVRCAAHRQPALGQLHGGHPQLGEAAGGVW